MPAEALFNSESYDFPPVPAQSSAQFLFMVILGGPVPAIRTHSASNLVFIVGGPRCVRWHELEKKTTFQD